MNMAQLTEQQQSKVTEIKQQLNNEYQICLDEMINKYTNTKVQSILDLDIKKIRLKISQYKARKKSKNNNDIEEQTVSNISTQDILHFAKKISYDEISKLISQLEEVRANNKAKYIEQLQAEKKQAEETLQAIDGKLQSLQNKMLYVGGVC